MGSWLCLVLDYMGAEVTGFSLEEESNSLYEKIKNDFKLGNYYGDLRNIDEIRKCMEISQYGCRISPGGFRIYKRVQK